jgi:hypothetical protein
VTNIYRHGWLPSRRAFLGGVVTTSAIVGANLLSPRFASAKDDFDQPECKASPNSIPGGVAPFAPFGILIHHNPLNPAVALADINDPSQITDFSGFVGLTHIRGGGTGTDTTTGETVSLAYQADMGFSQGRFIGTDGRSHEATFAFV